MNTISKQKGASIIAVIAVMLILSVLGVTLISLVTTGSDISVNQLQSEQAFYIAEGGLEYVLKKGPFPNFSTNGSPVTLGAGSFIVETAYLTQNFAPTDGTITVNSTAGFPDAGRLTIGSDFSIIYISKDGTHFNGVSVGPPHNIYDSVYPAAKLDLTLASACGTTSIQVEDNPSGFNLDYPFFIDEEYFFCTGPITPPNYTINNCQRCYGGSSAQNHPAGRYAAQYILTSTGQVGSGLSTPAQRVIKMSAGPREN